jgi:hypothetical protein
VVEEVELVVEEVVVLEVAVVEHYHFLCCSIAVTQQTFCNNC